MDYDTLIVQPFHEVTMRVAHFLPSLLMALGILIVGCFVAHLVERLISKAFRSMEIDKVTDNFGLTKALRRGGIRKKPSDVIGCLTYWVLMVMVLIMSVKALGLTVGSVILDKLLAYIPSVIAGVLVLVIGMLLAKFVSTIVYLAAANTDMPMPAALSRLSKWVIMAYVAVLFLQEVGFVALFTGPHYTLFLGGIIFALALAFGLAGKDIAAKYLSVLHHPVKKS